MVKVDCIGPGGEERREVGADCRIASRGARQPSSRLLPGPRTFGKEMRGAPATFLHRHGPFEQTLDPHEGAPGSPFPVGAVRIAGAAARGGGTLEPEGSEQIPA